MLVIIC